MAGQEAKVILCPSAKAEIGSTLIGIVGVGGRVEHLGTGLAVGEKFLEEAKVHGPPEKRFRFAAPCQEHKCVHWNNSACGVIGEVHSFASAGGLLDSHGPLPPCSIRDRCRWWNQRGKDACAACPLVVTDLSHEEPL